MIGRLHGVLVQKQAPALLLDINGVGYEVEAPMSTFYQLPALGDKVTLFTHLVVREDAHLLYGFATERERALFRTLIKVNGVGAKLALTILSGVSVDEFVRHVLSGDSSGLTRLPGVGKKTAERLVVEMRDRLQDWGTTDVSRAAPVLSIAGGQGDNDSIRDAISALVALGYKPPEASRMVSRIDTQGKVSEEIIRSALQAAIN